MYCVDDEVVGYAGEDAAWEYCAGRCWAVAEDYDWKFCLCVDCVPECGTSGYCVVGTDWGCGTYAGAAGGGSV